MIERATCWVLIEEDRPRRERSPGAARLLLFFSEERFLVRAIASRMHSASRDTTVAMASSCASVRESTRRVAAASHRVKVIQRKIEQVVSEMDARTIARVLGPQAFDADDVHFHDPEDPELTALYILCVDAINFCFWPDHDAIAHVKVAKKHYHQFDVTARYLLNSGLPVEDAKPKILTGDPPDDDANAPTTQTRAGADPFDPDVLAAQGMEYEHIAAGLKRALERDRGCLDPSRLVTLDGPGLRDVLQWPRTLPLENERARLLREIGAGLTRHWGGKVTNLIGAAAGDAPTLVDLVVQTFPGFRDATVDPRDGRQVFFYKRAQIFVGDVWGRFEGEGLGAFRESIGELTMFADYRVPVVLRQLGILKYSDEFASVVDGGKTLVPSGSADEIDTRACTVQAVERMKHALEARLAKEIELRPNLGSGEAAAPAVTSVALDWFLWTQGEKRRDDSPPHHRTMTVFY